MSLSAPPVLKLKAQIYCGDEIAMGPGKADLLEALLRECSISGAGRALGMSYRRTWMLVDTMNRCWASPLVETATGGTRGGGAVVTPMGLEVLRLYREIEGDLARVREGDGFAALGKLLAAAPKPAAGE